MYQLSARTYAQSCPRQLPRTGRTSESDVSAPRAPSRKRVQGTDPRNGFFGQVRPSSDGYFFNLLFAYNVLELHSWLSPNSVLVAEGTASFLAARMYVQSCPATTNQPTRTPSRTSPSASPPRPPPSSATLGNFTQTAVGLGAGIFARSYADIQWPFGVWAESPNGGAASCGLVASCVILRWSVWRFFAAEITSVESMNLLAKRFPPPDHLHHSELRRLPDPARRERFCSTVGFTILSLLQQRPLTPSMTMKLDHWAFGSHNAWAQPHTRRNVYLTCQHKMSVMETRTSSGSFCRRCAGPVMRHTRAGDRDFVANAEEYDPAILG